MAAQAHAAGKTKLVLSLSSNPNPGSVAAIDALNRYYGVNHCPLAIHFGPVRTAKESFAPVIAGHEWLSPGRVLDGVTALRKVLHEAADNSVRIVATGAAGRPPRFQPIEKGLCRFLCGAIKTIANATRPNSKPPLVGPDRDAVRSRAGS